jgi:hypothetical protein
LPKAKSGAAKKANPATINIPPDVSQFYSNAFSALITQWDFTLLFGSHTLPSSLVPGQGSAGLVEVDAAIRMSPQHAKAAAVALGALIKEYETRYGVIQSEPKGK